MGQKCRAVPAASTCQSFYLNVKTRHDVLRYSSHSEHIVPQHFNCEQDVKWLHTAIEVKKINIKTTCHNRTMRQKAEFYSVCHLTIHSQTPLHNIIPANQSHVLSVIFTFYRTVFSFLFLDEWFFHCCLRI